MRGTRVRLRLGSGRSEVLREHPFSLLKFDIDGIVLRPGEQIALLAPRDEVEVDMRHGLPRGDTVLCRPVSSIRYHISSVEEEEEDEEEDGT